MYSIKKPVAIRVENACEYNHVNWKCKNVFSVRAKMTLVLRYLDSKYVSKYSTETNVLNLIVMILFAFCFYEYEWTVINCVFNFKEYI
jgi:hypothetical protein